MLIVVFCDGLLLSINVPSFRVQRTEMDVNVRTGETKGTGT